MVARAVEGDARGDAATAAPHPHPAGDGALRPRGGAREAARALRAGEGGRRAGASSSRARPASASRGSSTSSSAGSRSRARTSTSSSAATRRAARRRRRGAFTTAYREHLGDDEASIRAALPQTPLLVPAFAALLRGDVAPAGAEPLTKDSLQTVFVHATRSFAAERPTIVLIDDLHFAPEEGRALFASLALAVPGHRVLLVGAARPGLDEKWIAQTRRAAADDAARAAASRPEGPRPPARATRSGASASREELAGADRAEVRRQPVLRLRDPARPARRAVPRGRSRDGTWETTQVIRDIQVPSSIAELVQARVADLDDEDTQPPRRRGVLRLRVRPAARRRGARRRRRSPRCSASRGSRSGTGSCARRDGASSSTTTRCRRRSTRACRSCCASSTTRRSRDAIEARSGAAAKEPKDLDGALCVDLAEHFLKGAQGERALRYLDAALEHLEKGYLHDAAVRLADRALAVPGLVAGRERCEVLLRKAGRLDLLGRRDAQRAALEEANALADADGDAALRARALRSLGALHLPALPQRRGAGGSSARRSRLARAAGDRKVEAARHGEPGQRLHEPRPPRGGAGALRAAPRARAGDRRPARARPIATGNLGARLPVPRPSRRGAGALRAVPRALPGDRGPEGRGPRHGEPGDVFAVPRPPRGGAGAPGAAPRARPGDRRPAGRGHCHGEPGQRLLEPRSPRGGAGAPRAAPGALPGDRRPAGRGQRHGEPGVILWTSRPPRQAREHGERSLALSREIGDRRSEGFALQCLADLSAEEGDAAAAERRFAEALALRREIGQRDGEAETLVARGAHLARQGREAEARADLDAALALARELSLPDVELLATAQLATLPGGDVAAALAALAAHEGHVEMQEAMQARFLLWQATRDPAHLAEAKRLLDFIVEHAPPECRQPMLANVRLHREIAAAAREQGLPLAADASGDGDERSAGSRRRVTPARPLLGGARRTIRRCSPLPTMLPAPSGAMVPADL